MRSSAVSLKAMICALLSPLLVFAAQGGDGVGSTVMAPLAIVWTLIAIKASAINSENDEWRNFPRYRPGITSCQALQPTRGEILRVSRKQIATTAVFHPPQEELLS